MKKNIKAYIELNRGSLPIRYKFNDKEYDLKPTARGGLILNKSEEPTDNKKELTKE